MPGSELSQLRGGLEGVMREAGEIARSTLRGSFQHWNKGHDNSPVSDGDIAVNNFLRPRLSALVPEAGWLSEETEDSPAARLAPRAWIVDPIDGTRAYISNRDDWTISVALVEHGRPLLAALYAPATEEMFLAVAGRGTTVNGAAGAVSQGASLNGATVAGPKRLIERLSKQSPELLAQPKVYSLALRLARVAHAGLDVAFAAPGSRDWDLAAADLLIHEAGGLLTDLRGQPLSFNRTETVHGALVAAGPARHATLIGLLRGHQPGLA